MRSFRFFAALMTIVFILNAMVINALPEQGEMGNIAPTIDLSVTAKKKPVDIVVLTDYTGTKRTSLDTQINALKANFAAVNVAPVFHIVSSVKKIGTQSDDLYMYRRYGRFSYTVSSYQRYKDYGLEESYAPYTINQTVLWEETQGLYSSPESLPVRQPQVSFTAGPLINWRSSSGNTYKNYKDITLTCTNDPAKSYHLFEEELYYKYVLTATERIYGSVLSETATVDSKWNREERIGAVTYDVLSLDFTKLNTLPLRAGSDRHMVFLSDSYGKNYGAGPGNYFSFGDMTDTLKNYIATNNFSLYGVVPNEARDMNLLPDKVSKILPFGNTSLFYMKNGDVLQLGDPVFAATVPYGSKIFPKKISDIGTIKEVIPTSGLTYYLMNDGTIKYVPNGSGTITTLLSGVTKVFPSNTNVFYAINTSGQAFMIYDTTVQPFNNPFFCDKVVQAGYNEILIASDGTPYMKYSCYDNQRKIETYGWSQAMIQDRITGAISYLGAVKNIKSVIAGTYGGLYPIAVQFQGDWVRQYVGMGSYRVDSGRYSYWYPTLYGETAYNIDTTGVDRIEKNGNTDILIFYKSGAVYSLAPTLEQKYDREEGWYTVVKIRNYLVYVPVANIQKTVFVYPNRLFMTDSSNNTYMYDGYSTTYMGNNIKSVKSCQFDAYNSKIYLLKTDGTVRELTLYGGTVTVDTILPYNNIENVYTSKINAFLVNKTGYVYATGNTNYGQLGYRDWTSYITTFVNPLPTTISLIDTTKTYLSLLDLFNSITADCEFYGVGQYAAAFSKIYNNYNNSGTGSAYVVLGDDLEYQSTYGDYESDPEHRRQYRITHNPNYFDNSMGLSTYHNPTGYTSSPPIKLDKVGRYVFNLWAWDNPKADDRFDNYRLRSIGDQNLSVYVHRKPIALQRITVDANGNGTYTVRAYDAGSYDLDHNVSRVDKGIVSGEWRWKDSTSFAWHYEQINKADCYPDRAYTLQYRVKDVEGVWSDYNTIEIADDPPVALFGIEKNPIFVDEKLLLTDKSFPQSFFKIDRWHWIVKKYSDEGVLEEEALWEGQFGTSNDGTGVMEGYDTNVKTDYTDTGAGKYRIFLRVRDSRGIWSDSFYAQDLVVQESFKMTDFRVVKVRDLHLESYYYNPATGGYDDKPMGVDEMAIDYRNFNSMVNGLTKGYLFEFEIDTVDFNDDSDTIKIIPHFYTCDDYFRDTEERDLYWENSWHEILKAGEGGHAAWAAIELTSKDRKEKDESNATWRGSYLIPGTSWAVPKETSSTNAKERRINRDIIVSFEIKGYRGGELKYDYNLQKWPAERGIGKDPYELGDVIRYSHTKNNLDDIDVILNRP